MGRQIGAMHVARIPSRYVSKSGEERRYESVLLRRTVRHEGKVRHETLANLSHLPDQVIGLPAAAHVMASKPGLRNLLGPPCRERDIAYALILSRAVRPQSKLSPATWWQS